MTAVFLGVEVGAVGVAVEVGGIKVIKARWRKNFCSISCCCHSEEYDSPIFFCISNKLWTINPNIPVVHLNVNITCIEYRWYLEHVETSVFPVKSAVEQWSEQ